MQRQDFLVWADLLPEPLLLVASCGAVVGVNRAASDELGLKSPGQQPEILLQACSAPESQYLQECARTREPLSGVIHVRPEQGLFAAYDCEGALVGLGPNGKPQILLRLLHRNADARSPAEPQSLTGETERRKQAEESVRQLSAHLLRIQDEERRRIAHELHDGTVQTLSALTINLAILESRLAQLGDGTASKSLLDSQSLAEQAARELRSLSHVLRSPDIDAVGLSAAIQSYIPRFSRVSGIHVDLDLPASGRLPRDIEKALFRVTQESLNSVHRHSGGATARVRVALQEAQVVLEVVDRSGGASVARAAGPNQIIKRFGVGLAGMEARLQQLGGRLEISSNRQGTMVRVVVPLPPHSHVRLAGAG